MPKKTDSQSKAPQPMDPSARGVLNPVAKKNHQRDCYAIKTLVAEVTSLFPETAYSTSNYDGRNTALDVTFDLTTVDSPDDAGMLTLLMMVESDPRVHEVLVDEGQVLVSFRSDPRSQDSRDPFGLPDAWLVLGDSDDPDYYESEGSL